MARKIFTAKEMREQADHEEQNEGLVGTVDMLRYAAEVLERCDWQKSHLDGLLEGKDYELPGVTLNQLVNTEKSIVDYIRHGDVEKEDYDN